MCATPPATLPWPISRRPTIQVPGWLVVSIVPSELAADGSLSTKKGLEDHAATAAAIQNFMLSLAAAGVGSKWMTGKPIARKSPFHEYL